MFLAKIGLFGLLMICIWYTRVWWINLGNDKGKAVSELLFKPVILTYDIKPTPRLGTLRVIKQTGYAEKIQQLVATTSGTYGVYVYNLKRETGFGLDEAEVMPSGSFLKVPLLVTVLKMIHEEKMSLSSVYILNEADKVSGSGPIEFFSAGTGLSVNDLLTYLGKNSDNTAWKVLERMVGKDELEKTMKVLNMKNSSYSNLETTAEDVGNMFIKLYRGEAFGLQWEDLVPYLTDSIYEDRIPLGLPSNLVRVVHKVATLDDAWGDAGIVEPDKGENSFDPYVIVIVNKGVDRQEATELVPKISGLVWKWETQP